MDIYCLWKCRAEMRPFSLISQRFLVKFNLLLRPTCVQCACLFASGYAVKESQLPIMIPGNSGGTGSLSNEGQRVGLWGFASGQSPLLAQFSADVRGVAEKWLLLSLYKVLAECQIKCIFLYNFFCNTRVFCFKINTLKTRMYYKNWDQWIEVTYFNT